jgi:hypothetical protein
MQLGEREEGKREEGDEGGREEGRVGEKGKKKGRKSGMIEKSHRILGFWRLIGF